MPEEKEKIIQLIPTPYPNNYLCLTSSGKIYKWYSDTNSYYKVSPGLPEQ